jgi:hypothetical protein
MAGSLLHVSGVTHLIEQWSQRIPEKEWAIYATVLDGAAERNIPLAVGGAFAVATYTGSWRNTKDLDLYVLPEHRDRMIQLLTDLGLVDYFDTKGYDRWWIYRSTRDDTIVDVIWAMANHRAHIDELWMSGPEISMHGRRVRVLPAEALLWDKLYIMQRERCDWPDVLNLLYAAGADVDWEYLLGRIGEDIPLMTGALSVFRWLAPGAAEKFPGWLWERVGLAPGSPTTTAQPEFEKRRADLLDRRPWFGPERQRLEPAA